jgi:flagellar biosynthesis/type III secretory pathway protein FliH
METNLILAALVLIAPCLSFWIGRNKGYSKGYEQGYEEGKRDGSRKGYGAARRKFSRPSSLIKEVITAIIVAGSTVIVLLK